MSFCYFVTTLVPIVQKNSPQKEEGIPNLNRIKLVVSGQQNFNF